MCMWNSNVCNENIINNIGQYFNININVIILILILIIILIWK